MGKNSFVAGLLLCVIAVGCLAFYLLAVYVYDCNGAGTHQVCMIPTYVYLILLVGFMVPGAICILSNKGHYREILRQAREDRAKMREDQRIKRERQERYMKWLRPFGYLLVGLVFATLFVLLLVAINFETGFLTPAMVIGILVGGTIVIAIVYWAIERVGR